LVLCFVLLLFEFEVEVEKVFFLKIFESFIVVLQEKKEEEERREQERRGEGKK